MQKNMNETIKNNVVENIELIIKKIPTSEGRVVVDPLYGTAGSAGLDLAACIDEEIIVSPGQRVKVPTGIAIQLPHAGLVGLVFPRSGNAWKYGISLTNAVGVIDSDYTGEIQVIIQNQDDEHPFKIQHGDRIAQLVLMPVYQAQLSVVDELDETERGAGGFGSTGIRT